MKRTNQRWAQNVQFTSGVVFVLLATMPVCSAQTFTEQTNIVLTGVSRSSVEWGDFDNDNDLDILLTGYTGGSRISKIYRNNGGNSFTEVTNSTIPGVGWGSVEWGDYDNDGDLDILLTGNPGSMPVSSLYRNNGTNGFTVQTNVVMTPVSDGDVAWGDCDNDGDLDILLSGDATGYGSPVTAVYRNDGRGGFAELASAGLAPVYNSSLAWGDYDNDGDLDILLTGNDTGTYISKLYRNEGDGRFAEHTSVALTPVESGDVAWGDYDNDGDLDILLTGAIGSPTYSNISKIYRNDGTGTFTELTAVVMTGVFVGSVKWGDYDNDGDLDILLTGSGGGGIAKIYRNDGSSIFSEQSAITLPGVSFSSVAWGDYDNDGDLDILLTGEKAGGIHIAKVFRNAGVPMNTPPLTPASCIASAIDGKFAVSWGASTDAQTPAAGLSYNLIIESATGGVTRCAAMSNPSNGWRQIVRAGPIKGTQWEWTPVGTACGSYRCRVQALDTASAGSGFSVWSAPVTLVGVPGEISASDGFGGGVQVTWSAVSGAEAYEVWRSQSADPSTALHLSSGADPATTNYSDTTGAFDVRYYYWVRARYQGQTSAFAQPDVGFLGRFQEQAATGIPDVSNGSADWGDYDNDGDLDLLVTGSSGGGYLSRIYRNNGNGTFTNSGVVLPGLYYSAAKWGDYDNDGDLDILMAGCDRFVGNSNPHLTQIYRNDGAGVFTNAGIDLPGVHSCSLAWGDYDNDGWLDFVLAGESGAYPFTKICRLYRNTGTGVFTEQHDVSFPAFSSGALAWGDYDNDGDLDLLLAGWTGDFGKVLNIYRNDGNNNFSVLTGSGASSCDVAWGDYDNDGDLDILIGGTFGESAPATLIYRNGGSDTFTYQSNTVLEASSIVAWGDCDNDGDLDILTASHVYRNDGGNAFTIITSPLLSGGGGVCWGDYDNDGDLDLYVSGTLLKNDSAYHNTPPTPSSGISVSLVNSRFFAAWRPCADVQTPSGGLSYNIRIRSVSGGEERGAPMSSTGGWRRVVQRGPVQGTNWIWNPVGVPCGAYRAGVQAVDAAFSGSPFIESTSTVTLIGVPGNVAASDGDGFVKGRVDVTWTPVSGAESYEVWRNTTPDPATAQHISTGNDPISTTFTDPNPTPWQKYFYWVRTRYQGQSSAFGLPDSGYSGRFTEQTNIVLSPATDSRIAWGDYDNDGFLDILLTGYRLTSPGHITFISSVYRNDRPGNFTEISAGLPGLYSGRGVWGDYDNDGKLDVLLIAQSASMIYRNQGDGSFAAQTNVALSAVSEGSAAWGDYDNDGFLDILLTGELGSPTYAGTTKLYHNNKDGTFIENTNTSFKGIYLGSVAWGDYDKDGDLDILMAGRYNSSARTMIYRNNGDGTFAEQTAISLTGVEHGSVAWGDYDNDGDLDILMTGFVQTYTFTFKVYRNDGNNTFTELSSAEGLCDSSASWGDFDNDGDLDILVTGNSSSGGNAPVAWVYRNLESDVFVRQDTGISLAGVQDGSASWGDFDNDGDLDIVITGDASLDSMANAPVTKLYRNDGPISNSPPSMCSGLLATYVASNNSAVISWNAATDGQTPAAGLTYNLRMGSALGLVNVISGMADVSNGWRRLPAPASVNGRLSWTVTGLNPARAYYWSVQAIDSTFAGGAWAATKFFGNSNPVAEITVTPSERDFGAVLAGQTVDRTFSVQNVGGGTLAGSASIASPYSVIAGGNYSLTAGASQTVTVRYSPTVVGTNSGSVLFSGALGANRAVFGTSYLAPEMDVQGNGVSIMDGSNAPSASDHTDFGPAAVAGGIVVRTFTIRNIGNADLNLTGTPLVSISGAHASNFSITNMPVTPVPPSGSTILQVKFDPSATGVRTAAISIANNDADENPYNFNIQGTGTAPEMDVKGNSVSIVDGDAMPSLTDHTDFGSAMMVGETVVRTYTITNSGNAPLNLTGTPTVVASGDFTVTSQPAGTVAAGGTTSFQVTFDPMALGLRSGTLSIANDDANENPYNFSIQGTGITEPTKIIGLSGNLIFGNVATGQVATRVMTITNLGNSVLAVTNITCPPGFSGAWTGALAAGKATNVAVTFAPAALQDYGGTIAVLSDAIGGANTISCSGTGIVQPGILFSEGFDSSTLPAGWATEAVPGSPVIDLVASSVHPTGFSPYAGSHFVRFNSYTYSSASIALLRMTNSISTVNYTNIQVNFAWTRDNGYSYANDYVTVQWSTNGISWNNASNYYRYSAAGDAWHAIECSLPSASGGCPVLYIGFLFTAVCGNDCHLDEMQVVCTDVSVPPPRPLVQADVNFGVMSNRFGFNINWTSGRVVVVDASTNLTQTNWTPLATGTLAGGPYYFFDSKWTNYIGRYYRIRSQP